MKKEKYERTELEVIEFQTEDVIMPSGIDYEDDELPLIPNKEIQYVTSQNAHERTDPFVCVFSVL